MSWLSIADGSRRNSRVHGEFINHKCGNLFNQLHISPSPLLFAPARSVSLRPDNKQTNWKIKVSFNELFNAVSMTFCQHNQRNQFVNRLGCAPCAFPFSTLRWKHAHTHKLWKKKENREKSFSFVRSLFIKWYYSSSAAPAPDVINIWGCSQLAHTHIHHSPIISFRPPPSLATADCYLRNDLFFVFLDVCAASRTMHAHSIS